MINPTAPLTFEVDGVLYMSQRLNAFDAIDVAALLTPFIPAAAPLVAPTIFAAMNKPGTGASRDIQRDFWVSFMDSTAVQDALRKGLRDAFGAMSPTDRQFILRKLLGSVKKSNGSGVWAEILPDGAREPVHQECRDPMVMLQIATVVGRDMLRGFLDASAWRSIVEALEIPGTSDLFASTDTSTTSTEPPAAPHPSAPPSTSASPAA